MRSALDRTRAGIAFELASYYAELSRPEPEPQFSLSRLLLSRLDGPPLNRDGQYELEVVRAHAVTQGELARLGVCTVPWRALTRALATIPGTKGGYLTAVEVQPGVQAMRPWSVTLQAGVQAIESVSAPTVDAPYLATAPSGAWLGEGTAASDASPVLGSASLVQKTFVASTTISEQMLRQGGPEVDRFVAEMLLRIAGRGLDGAVLAGTGGAQPAGLLNAGLTSQSGTSLSWATTLGVFKTLHNAGVDPARISVVLAPAAAETLAQREKISTAGRFILDAGRINEAPAFTTPDMGATANAIVGDFGTVAVALFAGGLRVDVSRAAGFNSATVAVRVMLEADAAPLAPSALVKIAAIT